MQVPDSTPVIMYHDPANFDQLDGVTWDGKTEGRLGTGVSSGGAGNPQGTYYTTVTDIRDRSDNVIAAYSPKTGTIFWADDGAHFCDLIRVASRDISGPGILRIGALNQPMRNVAQVGMFGPATSNAGGPVVISCSPAADRAVVYQAGGQGVGVVNFWVIQLSSGHALWTGAGGAWIAASHDGKYVALSPAPGDPTLIYGADGKQVGEFPEKVFAFSWDGSLAVVAGTFGAVPRLVDWRTGQAIWTCPNDRLAYWQAFRQPGGSRIAIGATDPSHPNTNGFQPVDLFVVGANGAVVFERKNLTLFQY
jgi:hypothetical protein